MELKGTRLASLLNEQIDSMVDDDTNRSDVIAQMARAASISSSTVNQILGGDINCPPISRLEGFARVLDVSMTRVRGAAESDGCEYDEAGKALFCNLDNKNTIAGRLNKVNKKLGF